MHKYKIGQQLDLLPSAGRTTQPAGSCKILALLPYEGQTVQYRVRLAVERHERIVSEADLRTPG